MANYFHLRNDVMKTSNGNGRYCGWFRKMMKGLLFLAVLQYMMNPYHAFGQPDEQIIETVGTAQVHKADVELAKQEAIANGLVSAVDKALAEILSAEIVNQNFGTLNNIIYNNVDMYISDYKMLTEAVSDRHYRVFIRVKVSMNKLKGRLATSGLMQAKKIAYENIEIRVQGTRNLSHFIDFRKGLKEISGVKSIQVSDMQPDEATLLIHFEGSAKDLTDALVLRKFETFTIRIFEISDNKLRIELTSI